MSMMRDKSDNWILNKWWSEGIPLGAPGGASGSVSHIGSATVYVFGTLSATVAVDGVEALEKSTVTVYNVTVASGLEEYPRGLPDNTRTLQFRCRETQDIRYAFESGKVATAVSPYMTLFSDEIFYEDSLNLTSATLYLGAASPALTVEVEVWT